VKAAIANSSVTALEEPRMSLHTLTQTDGLTGGRVCSTDAVDQSLPQFCLPERSTSPEAVYNLVHDELLLDGNARQNLATFCTTWSEPEVRRLMDESIEKNMIDKDEYPQTAAIEDRCVQIIADLWHAPHARQTIGCSTTGSSEACILAGLALKWQWRKRRIAAGASAARPNLVCGPVQVCWEKFARYFDVELRQVPLRDNTLGLRPDDLRHHCDENTIGVVATLGVTFTGTYEPVAALAQTLEALQRESGLDIPIHVDAASGGFVAPFIQAELEWDFKVHRVKSINASGHKFGLAPLGVGWIIWRDRVELPAELIFNVDYLGGNVPTFALNFSRPGGAIIAQYYNFLRLGREGYTDIMLTCAQTAQWLGRQIAQLGPLELVYDGNGALPLVCYKLKEDRAHGFTMYDLSERLRLRGWQLAAYPLPNRPTIVQRILIRRGVSRDLAQLLLDDLARALDHLQADPVSQSNGTATFHH
jgi:glutamate decarboxylase